jgi:hypothetical protein
MALLEWHDDTRNIYRSFSPGKRSEHLCAVRALIRGAGWKLAID